METKIGTAQKLSDGTLAELHMTSSSSLSFFFFKVFTFSLLISLSLFFFFGGGCCCRFNHFAALQFCTGCGCLQITEKRGFSKKKKGKRHIPLSLLTPHLTSANKPQEKAKQRKKKQKQKLQFIYKKKGIALFNH